MKSPVSHVNVNLRASRRRSEGSRLGQDALKSCHTAAG
jgi:hypothetical protein